MLSKYRVVMICFLLSLSATAAAGDVEQGKVLASSCSSCHGPNGEGAGSNPPIAGLTEDAFITQLRAFKDGQRNNMMMGMVVKKLSDQDMADLAAYYATQ